MCLGGRGLGSRYLGCESGCRYRFGVTGLS